MNTPHIDGVLTADELVASAQHLARLQRPSGMIPWFPGGHCDPWNHVESAMALDVAGLHNEAANAYRWLAEIQRPDGAWHNYYLPDNDRDDTVEEPKLDTNVVAYIATGVWHHYLATRDRSFVDDMWPTVTSALDWVLSLRRDDGLPLWAVEVDDQPWSYALLTGTSSVQHALRCGAAAAEATGAPRPDWVLAADVMTDRIRTEPTAFEPKTRWAMDWYYPVLTGAIPGELASAHLAAGWPSFAFNTGGPILGVKCVSDEPWVTASETAEAAIAFAVAGHHEIATELLRTTRRHRMADGAYITGIVYPNEVVFPADEHTSYTAAAVILAADTITRATPAASVFSAAVESTVGG